MTVYRANRGIGRSWLLYLCLALGLFISYAWSSVRLDDAFIFLSYARNLIRGDGYVFNPGEHVNGCTSVLMPLVLAVAGYVPVAFFKVDLWFVGRVVEGIVLGTLFFLLMLLSTRNADSGKSETALTHHVKLRDMRSGLLMVLLLVANQRVAYGTGMESYLVLVLQVGSVCAYFYRHERLSAWLSGLAPLARPDAICVPAVLYIYDFLHGRKLFRVGNILRASAPLLLWLVFSYFYFGQFLPESTAAKLAQTESGRWGRGLIFLRGFYKWRKSFGGVSLILIPLIMYFGLVRVRSLVQDRPTCILICGYLLYLAMYIFVLNPPPYQWYYVPAALLLALVGAYALNFSSCVAQQVCLFLVLGLAVRTTFVHISRPISGKFITYRAGAQYLNEHYPAGTSVAANEIGVLRYFYDKGPIIDGLGLTSKGAIEAIKKRQYGWYLRDYKPQVLFFSNPPREDLEGFVYRDWFREIYKRSKVAWVDSSGVVHDQDVGGKAGAFTLYQRRGDD